MLLKKQKPLGVTVRTHKMVQLLAKQNHRKLSQQVEVLAEEECRRLNIQIPLDDQEA